MGDFNDSLDWDSAIENDDQFSVVPEGDFPFRVVSFERGRHEASAKIGACNEAKLTLEVQTPDGPVTMMTQLLLHKKLEWKLSEFFRSIGQKKKGERMTMDWNKVNGAVGIAHFSPRTYTNQNGEQRTVSNIEHFLDWDPELMKDVKKSDDFMDIPKSDAETMPFN